MKKIFATLLAATCALSMIGCGGGSSTGTSSAASKTVDPSAKGEGVMTYAEYDAAELESGVTIETYVQGKQSWWDNKATLYTQDGDGGYFIYELQMSEDEYKYYLDIRRFGTTRHAGFGLGFERAVMYLTGVSNIRDVLPYPRTVGSLI